MRTSARAVFVVTVLAAAACGSTGSTDPAGSGGATAPAAGGATGSGGAPRTGGAGGSNTGGSTSTGGSTGTGGTPAAGGAPGTGGTPGTGGAPGTGGTPGTGGGGAGGSGGTDAGQADAASDVSGAPAGGNSVSGSGDGTHPFATIAQAWWMGKPDPGPSGKVVTTVLYLLSKPFPCASMGPGSGWDAKVPAGTQVLELKLSWDPGTAEPSTFPAHYTVTDVHGLGSAPPPPGQAFALWVIGPVVGNVIESPASGAKVSLTALNAGKNATGTFDLAYGANKLTGSFDAANCATGGEP